MSLNRNMTGWADLCQSAFRQRRRWRGCGDSETSSRWRGMRQLRGIKVRCGERKASRGEKHTKKGEAEDQRHDCESGGCFRCPTLARVERCGQAIGCIDREHHGRVMVMGRSKPTRVVKVIIRMQVPHQSRLCARKFPFLTHPTHDWPFSLSESEQFNTRSVGSGCRNSHRIVFFPRPPRPHGTRVLRLLARARSPRAR
jgi:hypothetical protein